MGVAGISHLSCTSMLMVKSCLRLDTDLWVDHPIRGLDLS